MLSCKKYRLKWRGRGKLARWSNDDIAYVLSLNDCVFLIDVSQTHKASSKNNTISLSTIAHNKRGHKRKDDKRKGKRWVMEKLVNTTYIPEEGEPRQVSQRVTERITALLA